ncbi:MAG: YncE family protein [Maricaulaceae bacterium]
MPPRIAIIALIASVSAAGLAQTAGSELPAIFEPSSVSSDGVLGVERLTDRNALAIWDRLNRERLAVVAGCEDPGAPAFTGDNAHILAPCAQGVVQWINTASFDVVDETSGFEAPPQSVLLARDRRHAYVETGDGVAELDLKTRAITRVFPKTEDAHGVAQTADGSILVNGERIARPQTALSADAPKTEVVVFGMIHRGHRTSDRYSLGFLDRLFRAVDPDAAAIEVPPNRIDRAWTSFLETGEIQERRAAVFPEYTDVLFPLAKERGLELFGAAGWTAPMNTYRRAALARLRADPARAEDWAAYQAGLASLREATAGRSDDPFFLHSEAYDQAAKAGYAPYARVFAHDLGPGDWETINAAHYAGVAAALDALKGQGKRLMVTFGAAHKYWLLEALAKREDVILLDPTPFLEAAAT